MDCWRTVRKGGFDIHVSYGHTYSNNLYAYNTRVRGEPQLEIEVDLNPNLRRRDKDSSMALDARELADGGIARLKLFQIDDPKLLGALEVIGRELGGLPETWLLTVLLNGTHRFRVTPELKQSGAWTSLLLHVDESDTRG